MSETGGLFMSSGDMQTRVRGRYPHPAWTTLFEVRDGTGFYTRGQEADAMAFGTWPSRGLKVIGFEFKSYRGDWLRELKNPEKAENLCGYCDEWWLITGSDGVAKLEEIPDTWGWAVGTKKGLQTMKEPKLLEAKPLTRIFLMSVIRNIAKNYVQASHVEEIAKNQAEELVNQRDYATKRNLEKLAAAEKILAEFKAASGVDLERTWTFDASSVGRIVRAVLSDRLEYDLQQVKAAAEKVAEALTALQNLEAFKVAATPSNGGRE